MTLKEMNLQALYLYLLKAMHKHLEIYVSHDISYINTNTI